MSYKVVGGRAAFNHLLDGINVSYLPVILTKQGRYFLERLVLCFGDNLISEHPEKGQEDAERQECIIHQQSLKAARPIEEERNEEREKKDKLFSY